MKDPCLHHPFYFESVSIMQYWEMFLLSAKIEGETRRMMV